LRIGIGFIAEGELPKALWAFTNHLHQNGHTIVLTTHYLEEAESLCDQIAILDQGQLIAFDSKVALLARYPYRLLRITLSNPSVILPNALQDKVFSIAEGELVLRLHRDYDQIGAILESLRAANIQFTDLRTEEPGLEEVFVSLTNKNGARRKALLCTP